MNTIDKLNNVLGYLSDMAFDKPELSNELESPLNDLSEAIIEVENLFLSGVVKSLNSSLQIGDDVVYVGTYLGTIVEDRIVKLRDGTLIASLDTQPHKFRKVL